MSGRLVLGIDGGGPVTRAVLVRDGEFVSRHSTGPMNVLLHADASDRLVALIQESNAELVGLGIPGLRSAMQLLKLTHEIKQRTGVTVVAADDATIAQLGAFAGGPGIVVIAGTGSVAVGCARRGRITRIGGYGILLADEGSESWIGRMAIGAALRCRDRTGPSNTLIELVESACGARLDDIVIRVHSDMADRTLLARVAPALSRSTDPAAEAILDEAADHLINLATSLRSTLGDLPVAMVGTVFDIPAAAERFASATGARQPVEAPEFGAVRLASGEHDAGVAAVC